MLYKDEDTGGTDVLIDPSNSNIVYAALWQARQGPWENGAFTGPGSGLCKSIDGGSTWRQLTNGLPNFENDGLVALVGIWAYDGPAIADVVTERKVRDKYTVVTFDACERFSSMKRS